MWNLLPTPHDEGHAVKQVLAGTNISSPMKK